MAQPTAAEPTERRRLSLGRRGLEETYGMMPPQIVSRKRPT